MHLNGLNCLISLCGRQSSWRAALSVFQLSLGEIEGGDARLME